MLPDLAYPLFIGFLVTALIGALIRLAKPWLVLFIDDPMTGPHKFHETPTSRIGGLAVCSGFWAAAILSPPPVRDLLVYVGASVTFAFLAGLIEDCTKTGWITLRFVAPMLSGLVFCLLTGYAVTRVEVPFLDRVMAIPFIAIAFTAFAMASLTHAINIIDGFHGLATGATIIMLAAFSVVSLKAGDQDMALFCFVVIGVLAGFLLVNFPFGWVFLGDGGAYILGFVLASAAVMVPMRNPDISPWISVVIVAYPLLETAFSVIRKSWRGGNPYQPDGLHLHMLVYRRFGTRLVKEATNKSLGNSVTGMLMWAGPMASLIVVVLIPYGRDWSLLSLALLLALYALAYRKAAL